MFLKNSRYKNSKFFEPQQEGIYKGVRARKVTTLEGVIEHQVTQYDRLDHLAQHYFNDSRLWWRIIDANPELIFADNLFGPEWVGHAILIPLRR